MSPPETVERPRVDGPGTGLGGNWRVIVLNDDHNTFEGVVELPARAIRATASTHALLYEKKFASRSSGFVSQTNRSS